MCKRYYCSVNVCLICLTVYKKGLAGVLALLPFIELSTYIRLRMWINKFLTGVAYIVRTL